MKSSYLLKENLIIKASVADEKIYLREQKGAFQKIRRRLSVVLIMLFVFVPFIKHNGAQAIYIDLQQQQLHFFSWLFFPQDLFIISLAFIFSAFLLFYLTKFYGRVWCGFTCPQTIWMLMFNWIERRIEGTHHQSKVLDKQSLHVKKLLKKITKHVLWAAISLLTALVFISYFVPVAQLYQSFFTLQSSSLVVYWVMFFALCTYINAGWIREKMCQHMCPYSRFQSAMFDESTKLVSYDAIRGENRGKRKRSQEKALGLGDCVDCNLCVQVCPVGIDIRDGLQYECINCGLCVDACDMTMEKFNYDKGLISFKSEQQPQNAWKRHLGYGGITAITLIAMLVWGHLRESFEVNIIRDRQALYRVNQEGNIENTFIFKIRNKSTQPQFYQIEVNRLKHAHIVGSALVDASPGELKTLAITVVVDKPLSEKRYDIDFNVLNTTKGDFIKKSTSFYSGGDAW